MNDVATLIQWIRVFTFGAAICTTSVPVIYAFYPWRTRRFGQLFMLQAMSFAIALDTSAVFSVWRPKHIVIIFFADLTFLTLIAVSTCGLAIQMWRVTHPSTKKGRHRSEDQQHNVRRLEEPRSDLAPGSGDVVRRPGSDLGPPSS